MSEALRQRWRDDTWRYTPSGATDIRKTFARLKRQAKAAEPEAQPVEPVTNNVVTPLRPGKAQR